jgi:hypothetical protein
MYRMPFIIMMQAASTYGLHGWITTGAAWLKACHAVLCSRRCGFANQLVGDLPMW